MKDYQIGDWISCEDGIGQIIYVRDLFYENYIERDEKSKLKIGDIYKTFFIIKLLCDFEGKLKKKNLFVFHQAIYCNSLSKKYIELVEKIKFEKKDDYRRYIIYDEKIELNYSVSLDYRIDPEEKNKIINIISNLTWELWPAFTFDDFCKKIKEKNIYFEPKGYIKGWHDSNYSEIIRLHFYSRLMKVANKKMIFFLIKAQ